MFAVMAFQANAFLDNQEISQEVEQKGATVVAVEMVAVEMVAVERVAVEIVAITRRPVATGATALRA